MIWVCKEYSRIVGDYALKLQTVHVMMETIWLIVFAVLELPKELLEMFDPTRGMFTP